MYDMNLIIPICCKGRFLERALALYQYCILNVKNHQICVTLLLGPNDELDTSDWAFPVYKIKFDTNHAASKIYGYFANLTVEETQRSRWFFKLDDDSVTDVGGLLDRLNMEYKCDFPYYLLVDGHAGIWEPYCEVLKEMGLYKYFFPDCKGNNKWTVMHEWEGCIISKYALTELVKNDVARQLLSNCASIEGGYGDHMVAVAARLAHVHPMQVPFMTKDPSVDDLSIFGGRMYHIHYLAPDKEEWNRYVQILHQYKQVFSKIKKEELKKEEPKKELPQVIKPNLMTKPRYKIKTMDKFHKKMARTRNG